MHTNTTPTVCLLFPAYSTYRGVRKVESWHATEQDAKIARDAAEEKSEYLNVGESEECVVVDGRAYPLGIGAPVA